MKYNHHSHKQLSKALWADNNKIFYAVTVDAINPWKEETQKCIKKHEIKIK